MRRIYLDYAASTPIDDRVANVMKRAERSAWGNASSLHQEGERTKKILEEARAEIARILRCRASEIYFTSGGTEAANLAIQGIVKSAIRRFNLSKKLLHIICSSIEHPAILQAVREVQKREAEISLISPDQKGMISPQSIEKEIKENTILICLMHSNNEIGTIQPIHKVASLIKEYRSVEDDHLHKLLYPYFLVDASQSVLYEDVSPERLGADLLILDGIKMYGPRGVGALFVKHSVEIAPIMFGGGQERGLRPGTENAVAAIGLAEALRMAVEKRETESKRLTKLRDYAITKILKEIPGSSLNGDPEKRLPNNVNICFTPQGVSLGKELRKGLPLENLDLKGGPWRNGNHLNPKGSPWDSEFLAIKLDTLGLAVSAASACNNLNLENSSYVIESLYPNPSTSSGPNRCASSSLRFTFGRETVKGDIDKLILALKRILKTKES